MSVAPFLGKFLALELLDLDTYIFIVPNNCCAVGASSSVCLHLLHSSCIFWNPGLGTEPTHGKILRPVVVMKLIEMPNTG